MDEQEFIQRADQELTRLQAALEAFSESGGVVFDVETKPGGVIEIECDNGSKIIINRHTAAREIWIAAKSGGYHFRLQEGGWLATRNGEALWATVARVLSEQTGTEIKL